MSLVNPKTREQVDILFGEPQSGLRQSIRTALHREGYKRVVDFDRIDGIREALRRGLPDVLILDARMDGDGREVAALLKGLRYNRLGINPFLNIIVTLWDPNQALVKAMVDAGCDDMLAKPLSPGQIIDRINTLSIQRKPFVVTSDYIGPDRRKDPVRGTEIRQIDVPNTLKAKAQGQSLSTDAVKALIQAAQSQINDQKLKRNAFQICFLTGLILPNLRQGVRETQTFQYLDRLLATGRDVQDRLENTQYGHVAELCGTLISVVEQLADGDGELSPKDVELLEPLSHAILLGFNPSADGAQMAGQINSAIRKFEEKRAEAAANAAMAATPAGEETAQTAPSAGQGVS